MKEFNPKDFGLIAEFVSDELQTRKSDRGTIEKQWKEIDRQIAMEPDKSQKLLPDGTPDENKDWLPEMEVPLQAQTLEVLNADAIRMQLPDSGQWFQAHSQVTDGLIEKVDLSSIITGDENDVPSHITQDNFDKLVEGVVNHWHRQYDFRGNLDLLNGEAHKYGTFVGRGRNVRKTVYMDSAKGIIPINQSIPMLYPVSIKNTYLDTSEHRWMNEGQYVGPLEIFTFKQKLKDLQKAAKGSNDPDNPNGGWIPKNLKGLEPDKTGLVEIYEAEGDIIVSRGRGEPIFVPNAIFTVVVGTAGGKATSRVIRFRKRKHAFSSYIRGYYHREHIDTPYGSSPLLKGWPIQKTIVEILTRLIQAGALNVEPPIGYDHDSPQMQAMGGPRIYPGAKWPTTENIQIHEIGDPSALFSIYAGLLQQYADVTGVHQPRLGAQTRSHTTAYAKEAELSRGTVRTVDYVKGVLDQPMTKWLNMAYELGRDNIKSMPVWLDQYGGFVDVSKDILPEKVVFDVFGAGGPAEEQAKMQNRLQAVQQVLGIEQMRAQFSQLPVQPRLDLDRLIDEILREGGFTDVDAITRADSVTEGTQEQFNVPGDTGGAGAAPAAAIQAFGQ